MVSPKHVPTFYSSKANGSTIDLVWANFLGSKFVESVSVSGNNFVSDHQALHAKLSIKKPAPAFHWRPPRWSDLNESKIAPITTKLSSSLSTASQDDPNKMADQLTATLKDAQESLGKRI
ncbi:hypothetical protein PGTUg99_007720 [Puccinia graminis f. sp. tritici]|uniref:Endonuclease/exonuclease/phosphatase domain-containing protein n=1 Tax=Puccinia graminis f. sp. tritici TaxID=56615 RepID=A0A5B0RXQ5_PUCGR|nr:hypothetical protein PGTUg99_007720 [Puccinia graminis f. sp. tritici]